MDGRGFDAIVEKLAGSGSRRTLLRVMSGIALGVVFGERDAQAIDCITDCSALGDGWFCCGLTGECVNGPACAPDGGFLIVQLGKQCTEGTTMACSQDGGPTVCADNGIASDGEKNCCRNAGGACAGNNHCCAGLDCYGGMCATITAGLPLGYRCQGSPECSQVGGSVVCAGNGVASDGIKNCVRYPGGACLSNNHCVAGANCISGICATG